MTASPLSDAPATSRQSAAPLAAAFARADADARRWRAGLLWLALLGLVVRAGYVLTLLNKPLGWGDEFSYDILAQHLLRWHLFAFEPNTPSVFRAPLYPFLLAGMYGVAGHSFAVVRVVQALAGTGGAVLLALVGRRLSRSSPVGLIAGALFAINPVLIFSTGLLYAETLYLPLLFGIVLLWLKLVDAPPGHRLRYAVAGGLLFGLSHLMRPNLLLFPLPLFVWFAVNLSGARPVRAGAGYVAVVTLLSLLVVAPWTIRNYRIVGKIVPVSANAGMQVRQGSNDQADGGALDMKYLEPFKGMNEAERDAAYMQIGVAWIKAHPARFIALIPRRLYKFYSPLETSNRGNLVTRVAPFIYAGYAVYYALAVAGFFVTVRAWRRWLLPYFLIAYFSLLAAVLYGGTRYAIPVQPFLMLLAASALVALWNGLLARRRAPATPSFTQTA